MSVLKQDLRLPQQFQYLLNLLNHLIDSSKIVTGTKIDVALLLALLNFQMFK